MKKSHIVYACIPLTVLILLLVFASFYDLQTSKILADLDFGSYYSSNFFARFFEIFGEMPVYILCGFSLCTISIWFCKKYKNFATTKPKKIALIVLIVFLLCLCIFFYWVAFYKTTKYIGRLNNLTFNVWIYIIQIACSLLLGCCSVALLFCASTSTIDKLVYFALITLIMSALTNAIVQSLKPIFSRLRYRAMTATNDTTFSGFSNWYQPNFQNSLSDAQKAADLSNDIFKSFPSGHTAGASSMLCLLCLPFLFKQKKISKILIFVLCPLYVFVVGFSRIVMGAHFLSDVVFAMIVGYICFVFAFVFVHFVKQKIQNKTR